MDPPPLLGVFLLLNLVMAPEQFEHKHRTLHGPRLHDVRRRVGVHQFLGVFENAVLARNSVRNPPSWLRRGAS